MKKVYQVYSDCELVLTTESSAKAVRLLTKLLDDQRDQPSCWVEEVKVQ